MAVPAATKPRILVVDDDEGLLVLMSGVLEDAGMDVATASSGSAALSWLACHSPDLMLLDLKMKDLGGQALLERLRRVESPVPFLVVTGQGDEKVAVEVMKQGALDYVMKDSGLLDLLPSVVRHAIDGLAQSRALEAAGAESRRLEREMIEIAERERQRIGADLHDGLGQQLTAIELYCFGLREDVARTRPELAKGLDLMSRMLREAIAQTRSLARGLVPVGDDPDALRIALASLVNQAAVAGRLACRLECPGPVPALDRGVAGHLYRIAQEATNNALKHAEAREIVVRLRPEAGRLLLEIGDDGRGLRAGRGNGLGLEVMKHRASILGAELSVQSKRGQGVTVRCLLPLPR